MKRILLASLLGALVCVAWGAISWMVLKWHNSVMHEFHDESAVATALRTNTEDELKRFGTESGVFLLSGVPKKTQGVSGENPSLKPSTRTKVVEEPLFAFAIIRPGAQLGNPWLNVAFVFPRAFIACFILSLMLSWTMRLDYLQRVIFCVLGGLFAAVVADVPMLIWFAAPPRYVFINFADHLCEWTLAGLVLALLVDGPGTWARSRELP
jgi:hypothetical protein